MKVGECESPEKQISTMRLADGYRNLTAYHRRELVFGKGYAVSRFDSIRN